MKFFLVSDSASVKNMLCDRDISRYIKNKVSRRLMVYEMKEGAFTNPSPRRSVQPAGKRSAAFLVVHRQIRQSQFSGKSAGF